MELEGRQRRNHGKPGSLTPSGQINPCRCRYAYAAMEKLADYLDGIDMWFGDLVDAKIEYLAMREREGW